MATNKGVVRFRIGAGGDVIEMKSFLTERKYRNSTDMNKIFRLYVDSRNHIWAISSTINSGIFEYIHNEDRFVQHIQDISRTTGIKNLNFGDVFEDHSGNLWVGSDKGEILKLDLYQKPFEILHAKEGVSNALLTSDIYSIYEDKGKTLWIGTIEGLTKIKPEFGRLYPLHYRSRFG